MISNDLISNENPNDDVLVTISIGSYISEGFVKIGTILAMNQVNRNAINELTEAILEDILSQKQLIIK